MKICLKCKTQKMESEFHKNRNGKFGLRSYCKECSKKYSKKYREENANNLREKGKKYRAKNADKIKEHNKKYNRENADKLKKYRKKNIDKRRESSLKRYYGITLEDYNKFLEMQGGICAICGKPETKSINGTLFTLSVDHDHKTGKVRGLLCKDCNLGVGKLGDNLDEIITQLIKYRDIIDNYAV